MLSAEQRKQIADAYAAGDKVEVISAAYGVDDVTVKRIAVKAGVKQRRPNHRKLSSQEEFFLCADYVSTDMRVVDIAEKFGICDRAVYNILKRNDIHSYGSDNKKRSRN